MLPYFYANGVHQVTSGVDCTLVFTSTRPTFQDGSVVDVPVTEPQVMVSLSPQSAKDLMLLLKGSIDSYESSFGPLRSPFSDGLLQG